MVPHHVKNCFCKKKLHVYTQFPHGTQESIFTCSSGLGGLGIFGAQSWHSKLSNDVLDVSVAHLEKKSFQFKILQFVSLAYFLHIKANFKPKCLNTIENHALSNQHWNSSRVDRIISDPDSESLDITFSNKNIFGYYHCSQNSSNDCMAPLHATWSLTEKPYS